MNDDAPPPGLFTPLFWAAMGIGLALILAGAVVGLLGPRWLEHRHRGEIAPSRALTAPGVRGRGADRLF